ncbi:MAG: cytochrome c [Ardenticatenales bacterium]
MAMQNDDDAPFEVFRLAYKLFAWACLVVAVVLTVAIMRTLFSHTPDGTATTRAMARVAPTLTALVEGQPTRDPNVKVINVAAVKEKMTICSGCHTLSALGFSAATCPDLSKVATDAAAQLASGGYTGKATDVAGYLKESILDPGAYIVPGNSTYGKIGQSLMPVKGGATLSDADVAMIVDYLVTLK